MLHTRQRFQEGSRMMGQYKKNRIIKMSKRRVLRITTVTRKLRRGRKRNALKAYEPQSKSTVFEAARRKEASGTEEVQPRRSTR